jgi:putative chitinase
MAANVSNLNTTEKIIVDSIQKQGITDPTEIAQFLGQIKHESNLKPIEENLKYSAQFLLNNFPYTEKRKWGFKSLSDAESVCCGKDKVGLANRIYGYRMGSTQPSDGYKYRGRGYIQITGRENYAAYGKKLGIDLLNNPDLALNADISARIAAEYWKDRVRPRTKSNFADTTVVTKAINGGDIGLADRKRNFDSYYGKILGTGVAPITPTPVSVTTVAGGKVQPKPTPTVTPVTTRSDYIEKIYKDPFRADVDVRNEVLNRELPLFKNYLNEIGKAGVDVSLNNLTVITEQDLQGEFLLIDGVNSTQAKQQAQVKTLLDDKLKAFSPDAKYSLINSALFEMLPDNMRNKMSENSATGGANPNFSHAWRAPGKLSVTADFTIPGIAGLRIGQIFWIDRISEAYKSYGAFQLFGLTENIDISKGWTTSIHSRFNALPRSAKAQYLIDSSADGQTVETAAKAISQAK